MYKTEVRSRLICNKCSHIVTVADDEPMPKAGNRCARRECGGKYSFLDRVEVLDSDPMGEIKW